MTLTVASLCSGYEATSLGLALAGWDHRLAFVADPDPAAAKVLAHHHPDVPNLGDITRVAWEELGLAGEIDLLTAGFPCVDISCAGRQAGLGAGTRSGVWANVADAIEVLRPRLVLIENVAALLSTPANRSTDGTDGDVEPGPADLGDGPDGSLLRAAGALLGDLAGIGYDAVWQVVSAAEVGAPHLRKRVFILAWPRATATGNGLDSDPGTPDARDRLDGGLVRGRGLHLSPYGRETTTGIAGTSDDRRGRGPEVRPACGGRQSLGAVRTEGAWDEADLALDDDGVQGRGEADQPDVGWIVLSPPCESIGGHDHGCSNPAWPDGPVPAAAVRGGTGADGLSLLPTPNAARVANRVDTQLSGDGRDHPNKLGWAVSSLLPTPRATDGTKGGPNQRGSSGDLMLPSAVVQLLPTPTATPYGNNQSPSAGAAVRPSLNSLAANALLPTPTAAATPKSKRALSASTANGRRSGGGQSSPPGLDEVALLVSGVRPDNLPPDEALPPKTRALVESLLPTPTVADARGTRNATAGRREGAEFSSGTTLSDVAYSDRWGDYAPAIARWEAVLGRPAPDPTEPGKNGQPRLSPRFVEWLQGLDDGYVTAVPGISRNDALRLLGNANPPQQYAAAITQLAALVAHITAKEVAA